MQMEAVWIFIGGVMKWEVWTVAMLRLHGF